MAEEIGSLKVRLALSTGTFDSGMKRVGTQIKSIDGDFKASAAEAAAMGTEYDGLGQKGKMLAEKLEVQQSACVAYRLKMDEMRKHTEQYEKTQQELTGKVEQAKTAYRQAETELKKHEAAGDQNEETMSRLKTQVDKLKAEYEKLDNQRKAVNRNLNNERTALINTEKAYHDMREQTAQTRQELNRTEKEINRQSSAWGRLGEKAGKVEANFGGVVGKLDKIGNTATIAMTAPITAGMYKATEAAMAYEDGLAKIGTIADTDKKSLQQLSNEMLEISNATGVAIDQLTEAEYQALSSGVATEKSTEFLSVSAKAAKAGFTDLTTAVDGATNVLNAWGLGAENATDVYNKMIKAQDVGKTDLGKIAANIGNVASTAAGLNISIDETLAAMAALTQGGIETSSAFSMLNQVLANVLKPTADAKKQAKALGLEFDAAAIKSKGLAGFLADVEAKAGGNETAIARLFGSVEAYKAVASLAGKQSGAFASALDAIKNSSGAVDANFEKVNNTSGAKLRATLNKLQNTAVKFGETMMPTVNRLLDAADGVANSLANMDEKARSNVVFGAGALAAIGPTAKALGGLSKTVAGVAGTLGKVSKAGGIAGFLGAANPVGLALGLGTATLAAIGLVTQLAEANTESAKIRERLENVEIGLDDDSRAEFKNEVEKATEAGRKIIEIEAKVNAEKEGITESLESMLADDKFTKGEKNKLRKQINGWIDDAISGVEVDMQAKQTELISALDGIGLSEEAKAGIVEATKEKGKATVEELEGYRAELDELMESAKTGTEGWTADKIERFNELLGLIAAAKAEIEVANQDLSGYYENRLKFLSTGEASTEQATATLQIGLDMKLQEYNSEETTRKDAESKLTEAKKIAEEAGEDAAVAEIEQKIEINLKQENENKEEYQKGVQQVINDTFAAAAGNIDGGSERLSEFVSDYINLGFLQSLDSSEEYDTASKAVQDKLKTVLSNVTGTDMSNVDVAGMIEDGTLDIFVGKYITQLQESMTTELESGDFNPMLEMLKGSLANGSLDGVDVSGLSDNVKALFGMVDLTESAGEISKNIWAPLATGLTENSDGAQTAMTDANQKIIDAIKEKWDINSPSGVMKEIFRYIMEGGGLGITENAGLITGPFADIANNDMPQFGRDMIDRLISGINERAISLKNAVSTAIRDAIDAGKLQVGDGIRIPVKLDYEDPETKKYGRMLGI